MRSVVIFSLIISVLITTPIHAEDMRVGEVSGDFANVRSIPANTGNWVSSIYKGDRLFIYGQVDNWHYVRTPNGTLGWVEAKEISLFSEPEAEVVPPSNLERNTPYSTMPIYGWMKDPKIPSNWQPFTFNGRTYFVIPLDGESH